MEPTAIEWKAKADKIIGELGEEFLREFRTLFTQWNEQLLATKEPEAVIACLSHLLKLFIAPILASFMKMVRKGKEYEYLLGELKHLGSLSVDIFTEYKDAT